MALSDYVTDKPTIESKNLIIRPFQKKDVEDLREWTPNKTIYKYWGKNPGKTDLKPELLLEKKEKPQKSFHLYLEYKENHKVIGDIYIYLIEKDIKGKIAIRLHPDYHNRGIGSEATTTMCSWCFEHTELKTIWTDVSKDNIASQKMLQKTGFIKVKEVLGGKMVSTICDYDVFELNKE